MHHLHTRSGLLLVFVILLAVIAVSQVALKGARVDLTENRVYSLSEGSENLICLLYTSPSPRDRTRSRMPSSA